MGGKKQRGEKQREREGPAHCAHHISGYRRVSRVRVIHALLRAREHIVAEVMYTAAFGLSLSLSTSLILRVYIYVCVLLLRIRHVVAAYVRTRL